MSKFLITLMTVWAIVISVAPLPTPIVSLAAAEQPPVKLSRTGICHAPGTTYYNQTKHFTPFNSLDACLKAGGRLPKR